MARFKSSRNSPEVRRFHYAAEHRLDGARFLLQQGGYTTAAVYLAGYAVECDLKALVLSREPEARHRDTLSSFRGAKAHDFEWLKQELSKRNSALPKDISQYLVRVASWTTDLRYSPKTLKREDAEGFLRAAEEISHWTESRL